MLRWQESKVRSRARILHLCRALSVRYLWTFTKRGKFESLDDLWRAWREFKRLVGVRYPGRDLAFVAVPEQHADGTWHLHVAVPDLWDVTVFRTLWHRALGAPGLMRGEESPGNVHVRAPRQVGRSSRSIAAYIAKYVGKGFEGFESGRRLHSSSVGIDERVKRYRYHFAVPVSELELRHVYGDLLRAHSGHSEWDLFECGEGAGRCLIAEAPD